MVDIRNEVVIRRPRQEVFERLSDPRSERQWNPKVEMMEAMDGSPGVGARFRAKWKLSKPLTLTFTRYDSPNGWSFTNDGPIVVDLDADLEDHPEGTWNKVVAVSSDKKTESRPLARCVTTSLWSSSRRCERSSRAPSTGR